MQKHTDTRSEQMGAKKYAQESTSDIALIFSELESTADIKERDLPHYLDVAEKTLRNWKISEPHSSKLSRLYRLRDVVRAAKDNSISKSQIRQLLQAPLDVKDEEQLSIVDMIKSEPESKFFQRMVNMLIENFRNRNGHFVLSDADFDRVVADLDSDEPSEAVKKARSNFVALRARAK